MMMLGGKKKKMASLIIAKLGGRPQSQVEKSEMEGAENPDPGHYDVAAEEILAAMERKDPSALRDALKSFVEMCMNEAEGAEDMAEGEAE